MGFDWGAVASGGASLVGGLLQNQANARQQNRSQDYMAEMSNTSHRREVKDLRAAGLNPILSATKGASTPSISSAQMENVLQPAVTSALDSLRLKREIAATESQIGLNQAYKTQSAATAAREMSTAKQADAQTATLNAVLPAVTEEAKVRKGQAGFDQKALLYDNITKRINLGLEGANSAKDLFMPKMRSPKINKPKPSGPRADDYNF